MGKDKLTKKKNHAENKFKLLLINIAGPTKKTVIKKKIRNVQGCVVCKNF